jgi:hypothetical protein
MTLVIMGLLLGLVGVVWMTVFDLISADRQGRRFDSRKSKKLLADPRDSKAA